MAINFPASPSTNDIHTDGANRWQWNGSSWTRIGGVSSDADVINSSNDNSTTTLYPVMVSGTGSQNAKIATSATKNLKFDASDGNLTVGGATKTVEQVTVEIKDKNRELGATAAPTDTTADGGGITRKGTTDKTIVWENDTNQWNVNQKWTENAGSSAFHRPLTTALFLGG